MISFRTAETTATRRRLAVGLAAMAVLATASPLMAGPADRLRDGLARGRPADADDPPLARYVSEQGRVFVLDRTQNAALLKFEDSPEVWALAPSPAPRGDVIYKNDLGQPVLRATRLGGYTLFAGARPGGEAVSMAGGGVPLRLAPMSPQAVFERLAQSSLRASRAARRPMYFEAEATPASSALIADAAILASLAIVRMAQGPEGRAALARFSRVRFAAGKTVEADLKDGVLSIVVAPQAGMAGRPSSEKILRAAQER
jgi:hypothetical protein